MKCQNQKGFYQQTDRRMNDLSYLRRKATAGMMIFNSYRQPVHPVPSFMPRANSNNYYQKSQERSQAKDQGPWACDFCEVATFATFEEAARHEESCQMNQNSLSVEPTHSYSPDHIKDSLQFNRVSSIGSSHPVAISLCMPSDEDCLSDRQCYVRSKFVELFVATEADVAARHSKGAQKLHVNQIGIRCKLCNHLRSKDRAERAVCYPSSVSRIYQTVADMQRFHFMSCDSIPGEMKEMYKSLKTTRPRGVGSPQAYWISSANELGLVDTDNGIRLKPKSNGHSLPLPQYAARTVSSFSSVSSCSTSTLRQGQSPPLALQPSPHLPPLSPESQSTSQTMHEQSDCSDSEMVSRDSDAEMLLALKNTRTDKDGLKSER